MLMNDRWPMKSMDITRLAKKSDAFRRPNTATRCGGPKPSDIVRSVRMVVHRTLKKLLAKGAIVSYGDRHSVTLDLQAKTIANQRVSPKKAVSTLRKNKGMRTCGLTSNRKAA